MKGWELFTPAERRLAVLLFALAVLGQTAHWGGRASPEVARWLEGDLTKPAPPESTDFSKPLLPVTVDTLPRAVSPSKQTPSVAAPSPPVNPNTADLMALMRLPGVGPVLARRIMDDRTTGGPYHRPEDLLRVPGIGPAKLAKLRDHLVF